MGEKLVGRKKNKEGGIPEFKASLRWSFSPGELAIATPTKRKKSTAQRRAKPFISLRNSTVKNTKDSEGRGG